MRGSLFQAYECKGCMSGNCQCDPRTGKKGTCTADCRFYCQRKEGIVEARGCPRSRRGRTHEDRDGRPHGQSWIERCPNGETGEITRRCLNGQAVIFKNTCRPVTLPPIFKRKDPGFTRDRTKRDWFGRSGYGCRGGIGKWTGSRHLENGLVRTSGTKTQTRRWFNQQKQQDKEESEGEYAYLSEAGLTVCEPVIMDTTRGAPASCIDTGLDLGVVTAEACQAGATVFDAVLTGAPVPPDAARNACCYPNNQLMETLGVHEADVGLSFASLCDNYFNQAGADSMAQAMETEEPTQVEANEADGQTSATGFLSAGLTTLAGAILF